MRNRFDRQLEKLNEDLIEMGTMIECAISCAIKAISENNAEMAQAVMKSDEEINHKEREIESLCLKLLLQQQPVAKDLRLISSALKMITDMERIGDQASDICEVGLKSNDFSNIQLPQYIKEMAVYAINMVNESIDAFVKKDLELAQNVKKADSKLDDLFNQTKTDLVRTIEENSAGSNEAIDIFMIAKYLEKIGDHACNIAEWVIFSIKGEHVEKR